MKESDIDSSFRDFMYAFATIVGGLFLVALLITIIQVGPILKSDMTEWDIVADYRDKHCPAHFKLGDIVTVKKTGESGKIQTGGYEYTYGISQQDITKKACAPAPYVVELLDRKVTDQHKYVIPPKHPSGEFSRSALALVK